MEISITGNTSLARYCVEMLCSKGVNIAKDFLPVKGSFKAIDSFNPQDLAGEFDVQLMNISRNTDLNRI